jgi:hypothetical protein
MGHDQKWGHERHSDGSQMLYQKQWIMHKLTLFDKCGHELKEKSLLSSMQ